MALPPCVPDANVWIDLADGGLLAEAFQVGVEWLTLDLTAGELVSCGADLMALGLRTATLPGPQVAEMFTLRGRYPKPSLTDIGALVLAKYVGGILVTGDGDLRKAAEAEGVPLHGTLWILDELVRLDAVAPGRAADALDRMLRQGSRFPKAECDRRLRDWREEQARCDAAGRSG
ncbi:MAG: type II toxin-antitoxin system VapC family toxin [Proteobacteria bacterium]|nr:type II toxin-antitoxin system VapC family toxin [Pseudomonadota bacterium]